MVTESNRYYSSKKPSARVENEDSLENFKDLF